MMVQRSLLLNPFICIYYAVFAQTSVYPVHKYTNEDGFAAQWIRAISQDSSGNIWIGSVNGLNCFDGTDNRIYLHDPNDPHSIPDNNCTALLTDSRGRLWIGTRNGLALLEKGSVSFHVFQKKEKSALALISNEITCIAEDRHGNVWLGTSGAGISKVIERQAGDSISYSFLNFQQDTSSNTSLSSNQVWAICFDHFDNGWVGTTAGLDQFYVRSDPGFVPFFKHHTRRYDQPAGPASNFVSVLAIDRDSNLWICSSFRMIDRLDKQQLRHSSSMVFTHFFETIQSQFALNDTSIRSICFDDKNRCWLGTSKEGLIGFDISPSNKTMILLSNVTWLRNDSISSNNLPGNTINALFEDRERNLIIGTDKGVSILPVFGNQFCAKAFVEMRTRIMDNHISAVKVIPENNVWIGGNENDLLLLYKNGFHDLKFKTSKNESPLRVTVQDLLLHNNGSLWVATSLHGIFVLSSKEIEKTIRLPGYQPTFIQLTTIRQEDNPPNPILKSVLKATDQPATDNSARSIGHFNTNDLIVTASGMVMVATARGIDIIDPLTFEAQPLIRKTEERGYQADYMFRCIMEDSEGVIWAGSDNGLYAFTSWSAPPVVYRQQDYQNLLSNRIDILCEDSKGLIWIGMQAGISIFNRKEQQFTSLTASNGLPSGNITNILEDRRGTIWIGTDKGLIRYDRNTKKFRIYTVEDGLFSNEIMRFALCEAGDEMIYVGTSKGLNTFYPEKLYSNHNILSTSLSDLKIFGESVFSGNFNELKKQFLRLKPLHLLYNQNFFSIDFKTITFVHPHRNQFAYKLEGFDKDWNYTGNRRTAYFTSVPPGHYTFRVKAANSDGIWNTHDTSLQIIIAPPWYQTWWFYTLLSIVFAGTIYSIYRIRVNQILKLQSVRNRIASDLHDDIGSTLNSISIYSEVAKRELGKPSQSLEMIGESSRKIIDSMSDIVWTINPENDNFENIILRMRSLTFNLLRAKNIEFTFQADENLNQVKFSMETRKNLYMIFKEALNNLVKYSEAGIVSIRLVKEDHRIKLSIIDNGVGFDTALHPNGNGLNNMNRRAHEMGAQLKVTSSINSGTTVELLLKI